MGLVGDCEGGVRDGTLNSSMQSIVPSGPVNWGDLSLCSVGLSPGPGCLLKRKREGADVFKGLSPGTGGRWGRGNEIEFHF